MLSQQQYKLIKSLNLKKYRLQNNLFIVEGQKIIVDLLHSQKYQIQSLFLLESAKIWLERHYERELKVNVISQPDLERISFLSTPGFGLAVVEIPAEQPLNHPKDDELVLVLDAIRDPGNLGTIIRVADWFGVKTIVCSDDTVDIYSPKVIQASMGSFMNTSVHYFSLENYFEELPAQVHVYGAFLNGKLLKDVQAQFPAVLVIGNESIGISEMIEGKISEKIMISRGKHNTGKTDSLNAAMAASICMYHISNFQK